MKNLITTILISSILVFALMGNVSVDSGNTTQLSVEQMQVVSGGDAFGCTLAIIGTAAGLASAWTFWGAFCAASGIVGMIENC